MKSVTVLLLVFILPALCLAQTSADPQPSNNIQVLEAKWHYGVDWRNPTAGTPERQLERRRADNRLGPLDSEQTILLRDDKNAAIVTLRNDGSKTIKAVSYDFIFINTEDGKEWFRYSFQNRAKISARETKTLTHTIVDRRIDTFRPAHVEPATGVNSEIRVVINRVTYADGSVWQRH